MEAVDSLNGYELRSSLRSSYLILLWYDSWISGEKIGRSIRTSQAQSAASGYSLRFYIAPSRLFTVQPPVASI